MSSENLGQVIQVLGPVIDVEFVSEELPAINTALKLSNPLINEDQWNLTIEVAQQIGSKRVRCIAMDTTDGIRRGEKVLDTGKPISIPVGKGALGRMMNVKELNGIVDYLISSQSSYTTASTICVDGGWTAW